MKTFKDERICAECNRVMKLCFFIAYAGIFIDFAIKFNLWGWNDPPIAVLVYMGIEALVLVALFFTAIGLLARKGIAVCAQEERVPKGRYAVMSLIAGAVVSLGLWLPRFLFRSWEYGAWNAVLFAGGIMLATLIAVFGIVFLSLLLSHRAAIRRAKHMNEE